MDEILTSFQSTDELTNRVLIKNIENENNVYSDTITPHYDCLDDDDNNHEIQEKDESEEVVVLNDDEEIESEQHLIFSTSLDMNNRKHENDIFSSSKFFTELSISSDDATKTWALRIQNEHVALQKSQQQPQTAVEIPITKSEKSIFTMKNVEQTTTDGGYYTTSLVDGSVEDGGDSINKTKATLLKTTTNNNSLMFLPFNDNSTMSLWSTARENNNQAVYRKNTNQLNRTISQQMGTNVKAPITGRLSLPNALEINGISYSSSTSSLISLSSPKTPSLFHHKTSTKIFRLVQQMIDSESEYILDYFLKQSQQELYVNHHPHQQQEQLKILYNLLANVKSERIYNVLSRYYSFKITICDKNNNTLLHLLFSNKPHNFEPEQMKIITERYLTTGLKDFLNRPNLSNEYIIQILLQNKHFIYMLFFSQTKEFEMELNHHSAMCTNNRHTNMSHSHQPDVLFKHRYGDLNLIEEWRETYLYLIELLIDNGSKIDMPTGKYQNSIDCLLSAIISFIQQKHQQHAYSSNQFDIKYLKKLLTVLFLTSSTLTSRLKYTIERFLQLICHIHITNDELNDTMDIFHLLCQCEFQPIKLNMNTIIHLLKSWLINPNFLCSNLIGKCLFIQQLLVAIVRFHTEEQIVEDYFTNNRKLLKSTVVEFRKGALLFHVLSLIPYAQTCVQINSIYELTLALICHGLDPDYSIDDEHLLIVTVCLLKITNKTLTKRLLPFINLFVITQSSLVIDKSINILQKKMITKTNELYQHLETLIVKTRTLKQISIKHIYNKCKKPFVDSVQSLSLNETLKHRLIRLQM
ncbi:unnamed protein product [Didymodactylos carnosus]|nr:unnamed protein product [Didymodactylos carnosus]CAF3734560.1 unnamed protein product [Didymodactylos carnosus]